ncbi:hypothetical protein OOK41_13245 [Micromonospora sp. NBC_01655]|uniref:hypothetical protein n=1 Tax=Micromonospora sp. NBC_01655 TaxID=2975983 RepID=UPI00225610C0|nr:hypothetical protein [Micromonospora sp. NBC_01655]MCX4471269.1 hypothetical protein [Micromonospora sp. NBC_01655]
MEADLWSLGATLHSAVEGRSPYARSTAMATLSALATRPPDAAPHAGPLRPVLAGLLRREPRDRTGHDETRRLASAATGIGQPCPLALAAPAAVLPPDLLDPDSVPGPSGPAGPASAGGGPDTFATWASGTPGAAGRGTAGPGGDAAGSGGRRWPLAVAAGAFAALAAVSTAIALGQREHERGAPPGTGAGRPGAEPWAGPPGAPPPDGGVPPPPFPCLRPYPAGKPAPTVSPARGERLRLPVGWRWYADPAGFRLAVPPGWRHYRQGVAVCFQDPTARRVLTVAPAGDPAAAALTRLRSNEWRALDAGALPGYARIRLETVAGRGAEWEATWDAPYGARLRAVQLIPREARAWSLAWSGPDADWSAGATERNRVRVSFRPGDPG